MGISGAGIRLHAVDDTFLWNGGDNSSQLTASNVYWAISSTLWIQRCSDWRKNIWHWPLALKQKHFIWLVANDKLLTWDLLQHQGWIGPNLCFLCRKNSESIFHSIRDCPITKLIWNKILLVLHLNPRWTGSTLQDCLEIWSQQDTIYPHLPIIVCWFIWISLNKALFENSPISINTICFFILGELNSERPKKLPSPRAIHPLTQLDENCAWFDGASQNSGLLCGIDGKLLFCDGSWITWTLNRDIGSNNKAELLGAWVSLYLATRHNILDLHVRGYSKIIIDRLNKKGKLHVVALEFLKDRILDLTQSFSQIRFSHIYRELNLEANILSKKDFLAHSGILSYQHWVDGLESLTHSIPLFYPFVCCS